MIVTVTLNPSIDLTYTLGERALGEVEVHRARETTIEASGKGVNVSRTLNLAGAPTLAILPCGGGTGEHLRLLLGQEAVDHIAESVAGTTRINTTLLLAAGETVKVNGPGALLSTEEVQRLVDVVDRSLTDLRGDNDWLAICGSLPPGQSLDVIARLVEVGHHHGIRCAVDASGSALRASLQAGADLLTPNSLELRELVDTDFDTSSVAAVAAAAHDLARAHRCALLVSMGAAGAVYADGVLTLHGGGPALVPVNTAGAGDAFLSGWLVHAGSPAERMARALAFGRSACLSPYTVDRNPGSLGSDGIIVTQIDPATGEGTAS